MFLLVNIFIAVNFFIPSSPIPVLPNHLIFLHFRYHNCKVLLSTLLFLRSKSIKNSQTSVRLILKIQDQLFKNQDQSSYEVHTRVCSNRAHHRSLSPQACHSHIARDWMLTVQTDDELEGSNLLQRGANSSNLSVPETNSCSENKAFQKLSYILHVALLLQFFYK